jgi:hypothetical protein
MEAHKKHNKKIAKLIKRKQRRLANLINITLVQSYRKNQPSEEKDNTLRYYQGYHDVACIILSTLSGSSPVRLRTSILGHNNIHSLGDIAVASGLDMPAAVLLQISQSHFRDCMRANFHQLQTGLQVAFFPLLRYADPEIHEFLCACDMQPFFALSWIITWFAHDVRDTQLVKRLFDFFLVSHPLMSLYVAVAMVCHPLNREDVLQTECDFALVHHTLQGLPKNSSMVGWKYRPGDGYVSDDEPENDNDTDDENDSSSFGDTHRDNSQSSVDTEFLLREEFARQGCRLDDPNHALGTEAGSVVSSSLSSALEARVPFQEILDTAIHYMEHVPPRTLVDLACKYYGKHHVNDLLQAAAPRISMLETPPRWCWSNTAYSDRVLKRMGRGGDSRNESFSSQSEIANEKATSLAKEKKNFYSIMDESKRSAAVIAAGFGKGDEWNRRQRKKQRRRMIAGAVAAVVVAIAVGVALQYSTESAKNSESSIAVEDIVSILPVQDSSCRESWTKTSETSGMTSSHSAAERVDTNLILATDPLPTAGIVRDDKDRLNNMPRNLLSVLGGIILREAAQMSGKVVQQTHRRHKDDGSKGRAVSKNDNFIQTFFHPVGDMLRLLFNDFVRIKENQLKWLSEKVEPAAPSTSSSQHSLNNETVKTDEL